MGRPKKYKRPPRSQLPNASASSPSPAETTDTVAPNSSAFRSDLIDFSRRPCHTPLYDKDFAETADPNDLKTQVFKKLREVGLSEQFCRGLTQYTLASRLHLLQIVVDVTDQHRPGIFDKILELLQDLTDSLAECYARLFNAQTTTNILKSIQHRQLLLSTLGDEDYTYTVAFNNHRLAHDPDSLIAFKAPYFLSQIKPCLTIDNISQVERIFSGQLISPGTTDVASTEEPATMPRNKRAAAAREKGITQTFFGEVPHNPNCNCNTCSQHPEKKLQRLAVPASKPAFTDEASDHLTRRLKDALPEHADMLVAESGRLKWPIWQILGKMAIHKIEAGEDPVLKVAIDVVHDYYQKSQQDDDDPQPIEQKTVDDGFEPEDPMHIYNVMETFVQGLTEAGEEKIEAIRAEMDLLENLILDENAPELARHIAIAEHKRLEMEIKNVRTRSFITHLRFFNEEKKYGPLPEKIAKLMLGHIQQPGGKDEDPMGLTSAFRDQFGEMKITEIPPSTREALNDSLDLVRCFKDVPKPLDKNLSSYGEMLKRKAKGQRESKGKEKARATDPPPKPTTQDHEYMASVIAGNISYSEIDERQWKALQQIMQINLAKEKKILEMQAKSSKGKGKAKATSEDQSTSKIAPVPAKFTFQDLPVPTEGIPERVREALWNLNWLYDEIRADNKKVGELSSLIYSSIDAWSRQTSDEQWAEMIPKIRRLPVLQQYSIERQMLVDDITNAYCENLHIVRFFKTKEAKRLNFPEEFQTAVFDHGKSERAVKDHWFKVMAKDYHKTPEDLMQSLEDWRNMSTDAIKKLKEQIDEDSKAKVEKEWWEYLVADKKDDKKGEKKIEKKDRKKDEKQDDEQGDKQNEDQDGETEKEDEKQDEGVENEAENNPENEDENETGEKAEEQVKNDLENKNENQTEKEAEKKDENDAEKKTKTEAEKKDQKEVKKQDNHGGKKRGKKYGKRGGRNKW